MLKPTMFIGSATEGLPFAHALKAALQDETDVVLWDDGMFTLGTTFIETLVAALPRFDFAALLLTPDDAVISREERVFGPRDNVIFELGLFMGRLGRERTFIVQPGGNIVTLPSDLHGVSVASYDWARKEEPAAALEPAYVRIREAVRNLGLMPARLQKQVEAVEREQVRQREDIEVLQFLVQNFITGYERVHLEKLARNDPFPFTYSETFEAELRRLLAMGLIARIPGRGIRSLFKAGDDVRHHLEITPQGRRYLDLRREALNDD
jgi:hypothetical protein